MKLLVIISFAAVALSKPTEKTPRKRQFDFNSFAPPINQDVNQFEVRKSENIFDIVETQSEETPKTFPEELSNQFNIGSNGLSSIGGDLLQQKYLEFNGPEINNLGSSGLNSNAFVSTTTGSPLLSSDSFIASTSTISPLLNSGISSFNSAPSIRNFPANTVTSSGIISENVGSTITSPGKNSNTFPHSLIGLNLNNQNTFPLISSTILPTNSLQSRFRSGILSYPLGLDSTSYKFNNLGNNEQFGIKNNNIAEVTKSVYFYEAPEEPEIIRQRKIIQLPPQKKNYKLLFIKAPSAPELQPIEIPTQILNQEKTRVYVLVKKPETEQVVKIVAGSTPKPEKPEVFYIKYKTREEAEKAIQEVQAGSSQGQESISVNAQQLVSSIRDVKSTEQQSYSAGKQIFSQNIPVPLFEFSTPQPISSSTFSYDLSYGSGARPGLLTDGRFNQIVTSDTPYTLGSEVFSNAARKPFSTRDNIFSNRNLGLDIRNFGSLRSSTFRPITDISAGFSNFPSFVDSSQISGSNIRSGKVDKSEGNKISSTESVASSTFEDAFESQIATKSTEKSISRNDEPIQVSLGSGASTSSPVFTNSVEVTSETGSSDIDSSTSSE